MQVLPFFTVNSYTFPNTRNCKIPGTVKLFNLVQVDWTKVWSARDNLYKIHQNSTKHNMLPHYSKTQQCCKEKWKYYVNYHIIFTLRSHVDTKQSAARCAGCTINAATYLACCHRCKSHRGKSIRFHKLNSHRQIWWPAMYSYQIS
jgi:hypothetical protein